MSQSHLVYGTWRQRDRNFHRYHTHLFATTLMKDFDQIPQRRWHSPQRCTSSSGPGSAWCTIIVLHWPVQLWFLNQSFLRKCAPVNILDQPQFEIFPHRPTLSSSLRRIGTDGNKLPTNHAHNQSPITYYYTAN